MDIFTVLFISWGNRYENNSDTSLITQCWDLKALVIDDLTGNFKYIIIIIITCIIFSKTFSCVCLAAIRQVYTSTPKAIRENLMNQCAQILACYRRNCASPSSAGQVGHFWLCSSCHCCAENWEMYVTCLIKREG